MQVLGGSEEETIEGSSDAFEIPWWFRLLSVFVSLMLIVLPVAYIIRYSAQPERYTPPEGLGLVPLIVAGASILLIALAPWRAFGLRIRKVGFLEFERVVNAQATEHAQEFTELRTRLDELEAKQRGMDEIARIGESFEDSEVQPILVRFIEQHAPTAFSPLRVRDWGGRQPGFERLGKLPVSSIRRILKALVAQGRAATRISKMGNTLYKVAD
jgi:hypothetical protein